MTLLSKLSSPFENSTEKETDKKLTIFKLGETANELERKRKQLYEKLGDAVFHHRDTLAASLKEEIQFIEEELSECSKKMEMLSNEI